MAPNEPTGPLRSDLLSGNDRLQKCAQLDFSHVQPNEPESPHVRLIQEALRQVDNAEIPLTEKNYGEKTTKAVVAFKTKKNLFTRGTHSIDPIVGIGTITTLDTLMQDIEAKRKGKGKPAKVVPKLALSGQCRVIGEVKDNPGADDMTFGNPIAARKSATTIAITAPFVLMSDPTLETTMQTSMATAVNIAGGTSASVAVRLEAMALCSHFFTAGGTQRDFKKGSDVSNEAKSDVGFLNFVSKVRFEVDRAVRAAWKSGVVDDSAIAAQLRTIMDSAKFGTGQFSGALAAFIGGFQGYHVEMCGLTGDTAAETFTYSLDVEVFDHFAVAFWTLSSRYS
jgi:peptidoglycan hydrolase-like protein with peptidoglycan-binding domain